MTSLQHALKVASFATELAATTGTEDYLAESQASDIFDLLGEPCPESNETGLLRMKKQELFEKELVEIFIDGFMPDSGLWENRIRTGHEIRGALVVSKTPNVERISHCLVDMVLFHSDLEKLARNPGIVRVLDPAASGKEALT